MRLICSLLILCTTTVQADVLVAARTIPAQSVISADDILLRDVAAPGALSEIADVVGMEARVALFAGRPIRHGDIGVPAVVDRNEIVPLIYDGAGLHIKTEGRALDRAGPGDVIRVMNITSRTTVTATIDAAGVAYVVR